MAAPLVISHDSARGRRAVRALLGLIAPVVVCLFWQVTVTTRAAADETPEYRLKAAVLYNFIQSTEWPPVVGPTLELCVPWQDPFGKELDALRDKTVGARRIVVRRGASTGALTDCHLVFIPASAMSDLDRILSEVRVGPVLTVAESPGAARRGAALNMMVAQNRITYEANLEATRAAGLTFSSTLLRLATEVFQ